MKVVVTCLFNAQPDPQSGQTWPASLASLSVLDSVTAAGHQTIVLHDCLDEPDTDLVEFVRDDTDIPNAYWRRWAAIARLLEQRPDIERAWCVDGGDVRLLNYPWPNVLDVDSDVLWVGSEPTTGPDARSVGFWWMRQLHPAHADWIEAHADWRLLNVGLLGGHRDIVRRFACELAACWPTEDRTDMAAANRILYEGHRFVTGERVHTPMWSWRTSDPVAIWAHK
jgi:hypothetical protein